MDRPTVMDDAGTPSANLKRDVTEWLGWTERQDPFTALEIHGSYRLAKFVQL